MSVDYKRGSLIGFVLGAVAILVMIILVTRPFPRNEEVPRKATARMALAQIRALQLIFKSEQGHYAGSSSELLGYCDSELGEDDGKDGIGVPVGLSKPCNSQTYFSYQVSNQEAMATRCTAGGKKPNAKIPYILIMDYESGALREK
jgi:hypothetical protein